jgi:hypothetical protein
LYSKLWLENISRATLGLFMDILATRAWNNVKAKAWMMAQAGLSKLDVCFVNFLLQLAKGDAKFHSIFYKKGWCPLPTPGGHGGEHGESKGWFD